MDSNRQADESSSTKHEPLCAGTGYACQTHSGDGHGHSRSFRAICTATPSELDSI